MVDTPEDTATAAEQLTVSPTGISAGPEEKRRRWLLLTALALVFLAASVLVLGLALRGSGAGSGEVTASGRAAAASGKPERTAEPTEAAADAAGIPGLGANAMIFGLFAILLALLDLVFAFGAWKLLNWAWTLGIVLQAVTIAQMLKARSYASMWS